MARPRKDAEPPARKRPPATTTEGREKQLIGLAFDRAEQQIRDGTASSQVITHFLKLGTVRENLEREKLAAERELLKARVESTASINNMERISKEALDAFRGYRPQEVEDEFLD